jgi:acetolactate decarboxylase
VAPDGSVSVTESFAAGVPFFVWADISRWKAVPIPAEIRSFEELERFIPKGAMAAGLDAEKPLPFRVTGRQRLIGFHLMHRVGDGPVNMEIHQQQKNHFELRGADARIIGFHSTKHRGVFTPGDSNIHIHFQTPDNRQSGHIEKLVLGSDAALEFPGA